ncbi:DUF6084 family protein [Nonomuraea sp. NPDC049129]|uniref:DUF6084 family protein n=1 Tax=Nonomuraea sp. NPDC049129 TaxID=3155272 RepID=UPI0034052CAC
MRPDSAFATREDAPPPALRFVIESAEAVEFAAVPTVRFTLRIDGAGPSPIRSVALDTHIRIDAARRQYDPPTRRRLTDLFGAPEDWGRTSRSLLWARVVTQVPGFDGHTVASIDVACTYDFEVAVAKYFHCLPDGEVPLTFLFSGTIFYLDAGLLRAARIPWDTDVAFRMPVQVWKDVMEHYFPRSAWLRLDRDAFDQLYDYKVRHTLATWDDVVSALLVRERQGKEQDGG